MSKLILLGSPRSGKSSTGNSILGKGIFTLSNDACENSRAIISLETDPKKTISIIDGLDVFDFEEKANFDDIVHDLKLSSEGLTAFLFVIKYGERFTEEYIKVVEIIRDIFGEDVLRKFGICVLTCGDEYARKPEPTNVIKWFEKQNGALGDVYKECNKRCVLFDNRSKDETVKKEQVKNLMKIVTEIKKSNKGNYMREDFEKADPLRKRLMMKKKLLKEKVKCETYIEKMILKTDNAFDKNNIGDLESVQVELERYLNEFKENFNTKSGHEDEIIYKINTAIRYVCSKIKNLHLNHIVLESGPPTPHGASGNETSPASFVFSPYRNSTDVIQMDVNGAQIFDERPTPGCHGLPLALAINRHPSDCNVAEPVVRKAYNMAGKSHIVQYSKNNCASSKKVVLEEPANTSNYNNYDPGSPLAVAIIQPPSDSIVAEPMVGKAYNMAGKSHIVQYSQNNCASSKKVVFEEPANASNYYKSDPSSTIVITSKPRNIENAAPLSNPKSTENKKCTSNSESLQANDVEIDIKVFEKHLTILYHNFLSDRNNTQEKICEIEEKLAVLEKLENKNEKSNEETM